MILMRAVRIFMARRLSNRRHIRMEAIKILTCLQEKLLEERAANFMNL